MSTNVGDNRPETGRHYTVAELVARERAAARATQRRRPAERGPFTEPTQQVRPTRTQRTDAAATRNLHVTELLRREGVDDSADSAAQAPPALTRPQPDKRAGTSRAGAMSKAAVLFGLTVGGIVGLQSTLATSPDDMTSAASAGGSAATPRAIDESSATTKIEPGGGAAPTTSADVALKDNATTLNQRETAGPTSNGSGSGATASNTTGSTPTSQAQPQTGAQRDLAPQQSQGDSTQSHADRSQGQTDTGQPSQPSEPTHPSDPTQPSDNSGNQGDGALDDVLDPITGTVSGVLDAGTGLLGL